MDPLRNIPHFFELSRHLLRLPTSDRGIFSRLTSVSDIQEWTKTKVDEYRQLPHVVLAIHNLAAPIHRFSTEVLELVFSHCWNDRKGLRLSHVCSLWRSIILGRPALWADAVTNWGPLVDKRQAVYDELPFIDTLLSRSARYSQGIKPFFQSFSPRIVQSLAPYIGNVTSMRVALHNPSDLCDGLWPTLCSGMPKLDTLQIEFVRRVADSRDADDEDSMYDDLEDPLGWRLDEEVGGPLVVLPRQELPKLSRLTCPISLVRLFGHVPLKHVKVVAGTVQNVILHPSLDTPGRHLRPYRDCLETLELVGEVMYNVERPACVETLHFPSLRDLRITSRNEKFIGAIFSWLAFPQTTHIHITDDDHDDLLFWHKPFEQFFLSRNNTLSPLHPVITTVDRVAIRRPSLGRFKSGTMQCFAGDEERLRLEHYDISPEGLVDIFGKHASITHLQLSFLCKIPYFEQSQVDFRAFPHLVSLEMDGLKLEFLARMLDPMDKPKTLAVAAMPALCPSLAELIITCGLAADTVRLAATTRKPKRKGARSTRSASKISPSTNVDEVFREKSAVLQQVLARRASSGTRLTSLELRLRPATVYEHGWSIETDPVWPSPAAKQAVLESLDELVDDPVILKLLDEAGHELNVDEDEA